VVILISVEIDKDHIVLQAHQTRSFSLGMEIVLDLCEEALILKGDIDQDLDERHAFEKKNTRVFIGRLPWLVEMIDNHILRPHLAMIGGVFGWRREVESKDR
jgi:hypothetical protein